MCPVPPLVNSHATERLVVLICLLFSASVCEDDYYYCYMTSKPLTNKALPWPEYPKPQLRVTSLMDFAKEKEKKTNSTGNLEPVDTFLRICIGRGRARGRARRFFRAVACFSRRRQRPCERARKWNAGAGIPLAQESRSGCQQRL